MVIDADAVVVNGVRVMSRVESEEETVIDSGNVPLAVTPGVLE
jgi:hypothetical protein